jgi:acyl-CoA thioester hydrolase
VTALPDAPPFRYLLRIRYGECDLQKVVYNARYADYVDLAAIEFLRVVWGDAVFGGGYDYQVVRLLLEWRSPLRYDEIAEVTVMPGRIGTTSFVLAMALGRLGAPQPAVTAEATYVFVIQDALTKCAIPEDLRRRLEVGAPGVVIDHAGTGGAPPPPAPAAGS